VKKNPPITKQLTDKLGGRWKAVRHGFGWKWLSDDGREVNAYSKLAPKYDGDDDYCITVYIDSSGVTVGSQGFIFERNHEQPSNDTN
jgi:hypothetical protein